MLIFHHPRGYSFGHQIVTMPETLLGSGTITGKQYIHVLSHDEAELNVRETKIHQN